MKALKILNRLVKAYDLCGVELNNVIKELEELQEKKSLVKTLEKMNEEMIDLRKENQDLKSRSCVTCKYGHTYQFDKDIGCIKLGADTQGLYKERV